MKTTIICEIDNFLVKIVKHVSGLTVVVNRPRNPKLWAIAHETAIKHEYNEFLVISLKLLSGLTVVVNCPRTPKLWAITHENGHNMRNRQFFG